MTAFGARIGCTVVLEFKRGQRCVVIGAPYLHALLAMASFFDEQYPNNELNDFINSNYATSYEDPTLFSSLDYLGSEGTLNPDPRHTIFSPDLQTDHTPRDRISTPVCSDQANLQVWLGGQDSRVKFGETGPEYEEIKALYGENTVVSTLLTSV